ncbi:hypothetical protein KP509_12G029400 [Ceratopteris richardii]|uniref:Nudix hydrolase domain-containing protein n=1 Tax=Ceratopteris richardii TaxID=49495 RepID=A0A8T2TN86_CERRI|nr:hypothetical protein KP509_12G029400 [Ceratopteris richardii]
MARIIACCGLVLAVVLSLELVREARNRPHALLDGVVEFGGSSSNAATSSINATDRAADEAIDVWRTLELWNRIEKSQASQMKVSDSKKRASIIGSQKSVSPLKCDPRLVFTRKDAAVLVALFQDNKGVIRVILTKRAQNLSSHAGEVAIPGGKREKEDADHIATALREAKEEIGLESSLVRILTTAQPEPIFSKSFLRVTPVIGLIIDKAKLELIPNPGEVEMIFDAPLKMFLKDHGHYYEERNWLGFTHQVHFFKYHTGTDKFLIWGLTAGILIQCASIVYRELPAFENLRAPNSQADETLHFNR